MVLDVLTFCHCYRHCSCFCCSCCCYCCCSFDQSLLAALDTCYYSLLACSCCLFCRCYCGNHFSAGAASACHCCDIVSAILYRSSGELLALVVAVNCHYKRLPQRCSITIVAIQQTTATTITKTAAVVAAKLQHQHKH